MGRSKQLLPLDGEPLLRHTMRTALASRLAQVIVVLGHEAAAIAAQIGDLGQETVVNPQYREGQSTSVRAGVGAVAPDADGVLMLLGDQPEVRVAVIDALITAFSEGGALIVAPEYDGAIGHPVLFGRPLFDELCTVSGDVGAREVLQRHRAERRLVRVAGGAPPDVDTGSAYEALIERWRECRSSPMR